MPTQKLTDSQARAAKPQAKAYKLFDGHGLALWVSPTGAKTWRWHYRHQGKAQTMGFGPYPEVSLRVARERLAEERAKLRDGQDPMQQRRAVRAGVTLREACEEYWQGRRDLSPSYLANAVRALEMHVLPGLGSKPIAAVTRDDVMQVLQVMDASGLYVYVRKVRMWLGQVFDWAIERGHCGANPCASIKPERAFGRAQVQHFAALTLPEVPALMQRLAMEGELQSVLACRFLAYTWTRTSEMRMMRWSELDGAAWRLGGERMKRRRPHMVPLPRQALAILEMQRLRCRGSEYVWPCDRRTDRPMSENAVLYLLHRIGYKGRMTGHGWRTVASTWANEHGFTPDAIERQLAHAPDDEVRATYNQAAYLPERTRMMQEWADWLDAQAGGSSTVGPSHSEQYLYALPK
ncbi:MAG: integrase arm-type DNA-binding domain-containing protein [Burkholderiales bacterium]|nr:integrase arm-type DNA-binding domain-containing protein [Burkholderiales bacterium]